MSLPPELIDRVLKSLRNDTKSLQATALVSKAWASWSQAYLFESVHLSPDNIERWHKNISPDHDGPASYTRTLTLEEYHLQPWINPQYLDFPLSNLVSFRNIKSLSLAQWNGTLFNGASPEPYFGHFGQSLRLLNLRFCELDPVILFDLLSLLPNVQDLIISYLIPHHGTPDTIPDAPEVTPSFRGTLWLNDLNSEHLILKALAVLPLHFTTIRFRACAFREPDAYQMLLTSCRDTLVALHFEICFRDWAVPDVSLASCNELEEVHALLGSTKKLSRYFANLLSSITSQKLRLISLCFVDVFGEDSEDEDEDGWDGYYDETETWGSLDTILSRLAKQVSELEGKLTLELNIGLWGSKPVNFDHLLCQFSEYGRLEINSTPALIVTPV